MCRNRSTNLIDTHFFVKDSSHRLFAILKWIRFGEPDDVVVFAAASLKTALDDFAGK